MTRGWELTTPVFFKDLTLLRNNKTTEAQRALSFTEIVSVFLYELPVSVVKYF
jgi:hypothetical protein